MESNKETIMFDKFEFYYRLCIGNEITSIFSDALMGVTYWKQHRHTKCYRCRKYGHLAADCSKVCSLCENIHYTPFCLRYVTGLFENIVTILQNPKKTIMEQYDKIKAERAKMASDYTNKVAQLERNSFEEHKQALLAAEESKKRVISKPNTFTIQSCLNEQNKESFKLQRDNEFTPIKEVKQEMRRYQDEFTRLTGIAETTVFSNLKQSPIWSYQCESEKSKFEKTWFSWFFGVKYSNPDLLSDEQTVNVIMNKPLKFEFQNPGWARRSADQGWTSLIIFDKTKKSLKRLEELYMKAKMKHQELRKFYFGRIDLQSTRSVPIDDPNYTKKDNRKMLTSLLEELRIDNEEQIKKYRKNIEKKMSRYDQKTFFKICQQYDKCREIVQLNQILERKEKLIDKTENRIQDLYEVLKEKQQKVRDMKQTAHEWIQNTKEHQRDMIQRAKQIGDHIRHTKIRYKNPSRKNQISGPKDFDDSNRIRGYNDGGEVEF